MKNGAFVANDMATIASTVAISITARHLNAPSLSYKAPNASRPTKFDNVLIDTTIAPKAAAVIAPTWPT